ncbi:Rad9 [Ancylostoma caninum]|uniref:Rad9 n=1 Tax=Ancylostoma caninum TaxID=29170 RepID=A0A368H0A8_ANCCA|nr:Rad9 [Ancylostoma caninum]
MNDVGSSVAQPLNRTLNGTITNVPREKAVFLLHSNLKVFTNAIAALSKIGDEIFMQAQERGLCLKAFNKNRSAYGVFLFMDDFFTDFDTKFVCKDRVRDCRLSTKTALTIFKSAHFVEKNLVSCTLTVDCLGQDLRIDFQHTYDVSRSFDVNVMEIHKPFTSNINRSELSNAVTVNACEITSFLNEMHTGREELIMRAQDDKFIFKNYIPCEDDTSEGFACRTEITVQKSCFKSFAVQKPSEINFGMKEFKAIITFARQHSCDVGLFFDKPGSPLIVAVESDAGYSGEFIIATLDGDEQSDEEASPGATQEPTTSSRRRRPNSQRSNSKGSQRLTTVDESVASQPTERTELGRKRLRSENTSSQPRSPRPDPMDEGTNAVDEVQGDLHEEEPTERMEATQPSRNPLHGDSVMGAGDQNIDIQLLDENIIEQGSPDEQALGDITLMDDFELDEGSPEAANEPEPAMEAEVMEAETEARPNGPIREVNIQFQRRFLGIGSRPQHQSQAAAAANAVIVEPTQFPPPDNKRR